MIGKLLSILVSCLLLISTTALAVVNLNTATREELETIKGIGPIKAQAIIDYRDQHGPFKSVDGLLSVKGFGDKTVNTIRTEVNVGDQESAPTTIAKESEKEAANTAQKSAAKNK